MKIFKLSSWLICWLSSPDGNSGRTLKFRLPWQNPFCSILTIMKWNKGEHKKIETYLCKRGVWPEY